MSRDPIPRSSVHPSQHSVVDSQLKSLKLITRRLQSVVKIHEAELQILHRLFYKNKNQHRTALFWRNVSEIRRYSQRVVSLDLLGTLQSLRLMFHGSATAISDAQASNVPVQISSALTKGSWKWLPSRLNVSNISTQLNVACKLTAKMSEACSRAYMSFNRSLQSGAFLSLLLTFVAISSRLNTVSLELKDIYEQTVPCISKFLAVYETLSKIQPEHVAIEGNSHTFAPPSADLDVNTPEAVQSPNLTEKIAGTLETKQERQLKATIVLAQKTQETKGRGETVQPRKKKRKATKNEIDDIFGS